ncbi:MAG: HAD family phosphatase [Campylobacteraceae bacterium]|nr:HAD family phosphatase [Campylobacteraceae bacterium]
MKKFILFDNDGVLVETEVWYYEANKIILKTLGLDLELPYYLKIMADGGNAWQLAYENGISKETIIPYRHKRDIIYQDFIRNKNIEIPKVKEILTNLQKKYKMAIITTSRRSDFDLIHKKRGIVDFMEFSLCVEEYKRAKPYPDPYLAGIKKLNARKDETIIIEDSQRGLTSAYNAEIECVIVKNEFTKTHDFSNASYFIDQLEDLESLLEDI